MQKWGAKGIDFSNKSKGILGKLLKMYLLTLQSGSILGYPEMNILEKQYGMEGVEGIDPNQCCQVVHCLAWTF